MRLRLACDRTRPGSLRAPRMRSMRCSTIPRYGAAANTHASRRAFQRDLPSSTSSCPAAAGLLAAITEIYAERTGVGEVQLTMPAMARLTQTGRWVTVVAPLHVPYAPALAANGVRLDRLLLIETQNADDNVWACEQALRAPCCGAVLLWQDHLNERALRRLQLAAESAGTTLFLFRSARVAPASPAALRLHVSRADNRTIVRILKRRGGGLPAPIVLDLHGRFARRSAAARPRERLLATLP